MDNLNLKLVLKGFVAGAKRPRRRTMSFEFSNLGKEVFDTKYSEFAKKIGEIVSIPGFERLEISFESASGLHLADAIFDEDGITKLVKEMM